MQLSNEIKELKVALAKSQHLYASYDYVRLSIASPKKIRSWADKYFANMLVLGEVTNADTFTLGVEAPVPGGLFCQKIFGPIRSWYCKCLKYYSPRGLNNIDRKACEVCQVEITSSEVRRYHMGYIELTYPVVHTWYLNGRPNYLYIILAGLDLLGRRTDFSSHQRPRLKIPELHAIAYLLPPKKSYFFFHDYSKNERNPDMFATFQHTLATKKAEAKEQIKAGQKRVRIGAELLRFVLEEMEQNYDNQIETDRVRFGFPPAVTTFDSQQYLKNKKPQKYFWEQQRPSVRYANDLKRIRILESFKATNSKLSWMILTVLPILPPALRPIITLETGQVAVSDLNQFYKEAILANEHVQKFFFTFGDFSFFVSSAIAHMQKTVDRLIDNAKTKAPKKKQTNNRPLKSLTESLEAKEGRFREGLLGKRVDYSARSVIVVGAGLQLNQCGLPYDIAVELFQPNLLRVIRSGLLGVQRPSSALARFIIAQRRLFIWKILEKIMRAKCVILNRAPTLHRFGAQAFSPILVLGNAIQLHPSVCAGFNADFDGDQMAVHLPLYDITQLEARMLMFPMFNVLSPANGDVILKPTQDVVIGCHYLTFVLNNINSANERYFSNETDVLFALKLKRLNLHNPILVRYTLNSFDIKVYNNKLVFSDASTLLSQIDIELYKIFRAKSSGLKCYLLTNIGIFVAYKIDDKKYRIVEIFLETTAGRIVFNSQCATALKHTEIKKQKNYAY